MRGEQKPGECQSIERYEYLVMTQKQRSRRALGKNATHVGPSGLGVDKRGYNCPLGRIVIGVNVLL